MANKTTMVASLVGMSLTDEVVTLSLLTVELQHL
jgi:hypothetical protein